MAERADITITVGGERVGTLRQATVETALAVLPAAAVEAYGYRRHLPGVWSWSAAGETFLPAEDYDGTDLLLGTLAARVEVDVVVTFESGETETGRALVTEWVAEGALGAAVAGSFRLRGTGPLTLS